MFGTPDVGNQRKIVLPVASRTKIALCPFPPYATGEFIVSLQGFPMRELRHLLCNR